MRGWRGGVVYSRHNARFSLFRCIKNGLMFHLFWYQWHPIECLGQTNNIQSDRGCLWMGFVMLFGGWRVDRTNMGTIFISELVPHYPPQNNHFGSKWSYAAQQWQKCVNTTINWYSRTVFVIVWWSLTNVTAYNVRFGCNFFGTKTYGMDRVGCGEDDRGNNNIQKDKRSLLTYMRRCRSAHCNDLAVSAVHNPHECWKKEVPWDTSK